MHKRHPSRIVFSIGSIFAAFAVLVVAFIVSSLFVLDVAGKSANGLKSAADKRAVSSLLQREIADLSQRQSEVTWWDASVEAITNGVDETFFTDPMLEWFPGEYGIERSALISPDDEVLLHAENDAFVAGVRALSFASQTFDLVRRAQQNYMELRVGEDGEFWVEDDPIRGETLLFAQDIRKIDGVFGFVIAQAIVPDGELRLSDGGAHVLVVFRPFTEQRIAEYTSKNELKGFSVSDDAPIGNVGAIEVTSEITNDIVYVSWQSAFPSDGIWLDALPALAAMLALITLVMFIVTLVYARLIKRTREAEARNRYLANHDPLTRLPNRTQFDEALQKTINSGKLESCAVLCIDLDKFKPVNDTFGHPAGDVVLRAVAQRIAAVIGERGMVARLGGDEFIALLHHATNKDEIMLICDNLIESVCQEIIFEDYEVYVGASVGVAWWPEDALTADMVIRSADQALYRAKALGRGRAVRADELEHGPTPAIAARG